MAVHLSRLPQYLVGVGGKLQLLDTESLVAIIIYGLNGNGDWVIGSERLPELERTPQTRAREIMTPEMESRRAHDWADHEGYPAPEWWYALHDTSEEALTIAQRLTDHWATIQHDYRPQFGLLDEWDEI